MDICLLCNKSAINSILLSNNTFVHESCLNNLDKEINDERYKIINLNIKIDTILSEIKRQEGFVNKIFSFFSTEYNTIDSLRFDHSKLLIRKKQLEDTLSTLEYKLEKIYDYYLSYPPDWGKRQRLVLDRDFNSCSECGKSKRRRKNNIPLHVHHIIPLGKGGNNRSSNLTTLCEKCHAKKHGLKEFSEEYNYNKETSFSKRVSTIKIAANNNNKIEFMYKKPNETKFKKRTVSSIELVTVPHNRDDSETLCVKGFCELRQADRIFAIKRMKSLKIL